jgi:ABC-type phosphate/phosphonate transport system substrate-binding protein
MHYIVSLQYSSLLNAGLSVICQSLPRGIVVKFNSNDFKNSAADVLRKFVVVILPGTSFSVFDRQITCVRNGLANNEFD